MITVTLRDIAEKSGVSLATVSRVLSGKASSSSKKAIKVKETAENLGYVFSEELKQARSTVFGVVASKNVEQSTSNAFFSEVTRGIANFCNARNINIQLIINPHEEHELVLCKRLIDSGDVDGFILLSSRINDQLIDFLSVNDIAFVVIGHAEKESVYTVNTDNAKAFEQLTDHLIKLGHERIALINGSMKFVSSIDTLYGYKNTLIKNNIEIDETLIYDGGLSWQESYETTLQILSLREMPTAIVVSDDIKAAATMKALHEHGFSVPDDVSIVSYSDHYIAGLMNPGLTTIRVPIFELGAVAANSLFQLLNGEEVAEKIILDTKLIIRDSCGFKKLVKDQKNI
jgi:DNA-binding LacI/PurR family transcriptional regulator